MAVDSDWGLRWLDFLVRGGGGGFFIFRTRRLRFGEVVLFLVGVGVWGLFVLVYFYVYFDKSWLGFRFE